MRDDEDDASQGGAPKVSSISARRVVNKATTPPPRMPHSQNASPRGTSPCQKRRRAVTGGVMCQRLKP